MSAARRALEAHNEAVALARSGDDASAIERLREAISVAGAGEVHPRTLKALWQIAMRQGDWPTAIAAGLRAAARDAGDSAFQQDMLRSIAGCPAQAIGAQAPWLAQPATWPTLSVVLVSADDRRFREADAEFARAFGDWPHERIRIADARSMYDGYERGFARASGEIVVFSHDDVRFATPDFAARLADAMQAGDMIGVAGTTRLGGPALLWSGHPHLFGAITQKADGESDYEFGVLSLAGPRIEGAQGLDGVFIAARREVVRDVGFDPAAFDRFHFYDLDFSYRAHLAGARLTIASDLALIHRSRGQFDALWKAAQSTFARKFAFRGEAPDAARHWYTVRLPDEAAVTGMYARLFAAWQLPL
jgi:hypothetical protein